MGVGEGGAVGGGWLGGRGGEGGLMGCRVGPKSRVASLLLQCYKSYVMLKALCNAKGPI